MTPERLREIARIKKSRDDGYACGLAYAAAFLSRSYGEHALAAYLLGDSNLTVEDFRKSKVPGYDMRVVSELYRTESYLKESRS